MKRLAGIAIGFAVLFGFSSTSESAVTTFSLTAPTTYEDGSALPSSEIAGYKIYCGAVSGTYTITKDVGNVLNYAVVDVVLDLTKKYYCAATTYSTQSIESNYSNEVILPFGRPSAPVLLVK